MTHLGMTPHFTIRVWGAIDEWCDELDRLLGFPRHKTPVAEIHVDNTTNDTYELTISNHRGLELIPQKMLTKKP